jgi:cobalt transporter subunit CbtB
MSASSVSTSHIGTALKDKIVPALAAAGLGIVLLFGAGFAPMEALHNAAHDSRHSAGFPCH